MIWIALDCQHVFKTEIFHLFSHCNISSNVFIVLYITKDLMTFPSNLNVSLGSAAGNIEILGKQN